MAFAILNVSVVKGNFSISFYTFKGMGTSFRRNDFWDHLGGQVLLFMVIQAILEIFAPRACTNSPYISWSGELSLPVNFTKHQKL